MKLNWFRAYRVAIRLVCFTLPLVLCLFLPVKFGGAWWLFAYYVTIPVGYLWPENIIDRE
jgi:hypothetical protein